MHRSRAVVQMRYTDELAINHEEVRRCNDVSHDNRNIHAIEEDKKELR